MMNHIFKKQAYFLYYYFNHFLSFFYFISFYHLLFCYLIFYVFYLSLWSFIIFILFDKPFCIDFIRTNLLEINFVFVGRRLWLIFIYTNIFGYFLNNTEVVITSINLNASMTMLSWIPTMVLIEDL